MKRKIVAGFLALLVIGGAFSWPSIARWRENARRAANFYDVPQSERPLRVPTQQQLQRIFPNDTQSILENSAQLVLFSLEPVEDWDTKNKLFHRHGILGQTVIADAKQKSALLASLYDGFVPKTARHQISMGCFMPRHGLRATHNGQTLDLLICFSCQSFRVYTEHENYNSAFISAAPRPTFDRFLTQARVPLSP